MSATKQEKIDARKRIEATIREIDNLYAHDKERIQISASRFRATLADFLTLIDPESVQCAKCNRICSDAGKCYVCDP